MKRVNGLRGARGAALVSFACALTTLSVQREASAQGKPFTPLVRAFGAADDGLSLVWGGIRGAWNTTSSAVSYVVVDQTGRAVTYAVRRGTRPMVSFANSTATTFTQTGDVLTINFNRGLGAAHDIGVLTVNAAGNVTWQAINGVVDGVQYAYENGAVIAQNFASMRCDQVLTLAFGGDFPYSTSNMGAASADCARNIAVGFACSLPGAVYDLVDSSVDWYRLVRRGMSEAPCNLIPIPPADAVCGALRASIRPAEAITRCLLKPQFQAQSGTLQLNGAVCRGIGDVALGVVLDIATAGATSRLLAVKIARAVKAVYNMAGALSTVESMVTQFCGPELAQLSVSVPSPPTTYELWQHSNFTGTRVQVNNHVAHLGSFDEQASAARVPAGGVMAVFTAPNYQGACDTFQRDVGGFRYLSVGNDRVSSVRVGEYCPGRPRARLFANTNLDGRALEVAVDMPELASSGFDGEASSIALHAGARLAVYSEPNYGGTCTEIGSETRRLSDTAAGNDRVSSLRVDRSCERAAATLYADTRSRGDAVTIHADIEDMVAARLQNTSSIALVGGMPLALYQQANFQGACLTVTGSLSSMPSGWNDSIRSLKVNATCEGYREVLATSALVSADGRCLTTRANAAETTASCVASCPSVLSFIGPRRSPSCVNDCNRQQIIVQPCDGSPRQRWRMLGPLMINGENQWLHSPQATSAVAGSEVSAGPVSSRGEMNWRMDNQQIINHQGRCLEVQRGAQWQDESVVRLSHCAGSVSERFAIVRVPPEPGFVRPPALAETPAGELLSCSMDGAVREGVLCRGRSESLVLSLGTNRVQTEPNVLPLRGALALSGRGATLPARDLHDPGTDSLSVSLWFNLASTNGTQTLLSNGATASDVTGYNLAMRDGALVFRVHSTGAAGDAGVSVQSAGLSHDAPTTGAWHHFVAVIDRGSNTIRASLDGSDQGFAPVGAATLATDATIRSVDSLSLGAIGAEAASNASVDALRVYPRALTAAEISTLAASRR